MGLDVVVIGAGAAGLAAAQALSASGLRIALLEARGRVGGRIFTRRDPGWPLPVELGAEFLHGQAEATRAVARAANLGVVELADEHVWAERGRLRPMGDSWERLGRVLDKLPEKGTDVSFARWLDRHALPPSQRRVARLFVEGYFAADPERVSARWLSGADFSAETSRQYRMADGYAGLVEALKGGLGERVFLRLNTVVHELRWRKGQVVVHASAQPGGAAERLEARAAIVTLPLGVLKEPGAVRFVPEPPGLQAALRGLEVSHVVKLALRFREAFWDEPDYFEGKLDGAKHPRPERVDFLHDPNGPFPTWWLTRPWQAPMLTAWAGGPKAEALAPLEEPALVARALAALSEMLGEPRKKLERLLEAWSSHDRRGDVYSRGAYSYVGVGGAQAAARLRRPVAGTLFFAGEALSDDEAGTVSGALATGRQAAQRLRRALRR